MLEKVKKVMRISTDDFDEELQDLIQECKADLVFTGVKESLIDEEDELIRKAIITYCKANFGWENTDYERLHAAYLSLKARLITSEDYGHAVE